MGTERRKLALLILVISYITFISYVISKYLLAHEYIKSSLFSELLFSASKIVIPIWLLAWCYLAFRSISIKKIKYRIQHDPNCCRAYTKKALSFISLLVLIASMSYQLNSYTTSGCFTINDKYQEGNKHFIIANDVRIECDKATFNNIITGIGYALTYEINGYNPEHGSLKKLDI